MQNSASSCLRLSYRSLSLLLSKQCLTRHQLNQIHCQLIVSHPSASSWNSVIRALSDSRQSENTLLLVKEMLRTGFLPDNFTLSFVFRACAEVHDASVVLMYHALVFKLGWERYDYVQNGMIHWYVNSCQEMDYARKLFDESPHRDVVTWTALVNGYLKSNELSFARDLFDEMPERNVASWSAMINGYARAGKSNEALETFNNMMADNVTPNNSSLVGALSSCASLGALTQGRWIHAYITRNNVELDRTLGTALVDMYAKCGSLKAARDVFKEIRDPDAYAYTSLISGLADHGQAMSSIELFRAMEVQGVRPNRITFLCVLTACSRIGLVREGLKIFKSMQDVYGAVPDAKHYGCLVDLLGRAGLLEEAAEVVRRMDTERPDPFVIGALLNGYRVHGGNVVNLGNKVVIDSSRLSEPECCVIDHSGISVLLSNIYASLHEWDDVVRIRKGMVENGVNKVAGSSSSDR